MFLVQSHHLTAKIMPWSLGMQSLWKLYLNFYVDDMLKSVKYEEEVVELEN